MKHRIITIGREFGSGGRTIGRLTAERLGLPCYDQEFIDRLVEESGFDPAYIRERSEYMDHAMVNSFLGRTSGPTKQDQLWMLQRKLVLELAEKGPCVIVGRCADYILRDTADCLKVFVRADLAFRAERIVRVYGEREETPEQRLRAKDCARAAYYQMYTDCTWGDVNNYDLVLNSAKLGIETCADILAQLYRKTD